MCLKELKSRVIHNIIFTEPFSGSFRSFLTVGGQSVGEDMQQRASGWDSRNYSFCTWDTCSTSWAKQPDIGVFIPHDTLHNNATPRLVRMLLIHQVLFKTKRIIQENGQSKRVSMETVLDKENKTIMALDNQKRIKEQHAASSQNQQRTLTSQQVTSWLSLYRFLCQHRRQEKSDHAGTFTPQLPQAVAPSHAASCRPHEGPPQNSPSLTADTFRSASAVLSHSLLSALWLLTWK